MGGIFGVLSLSNENIVEEIVEGLKRLLHRGNDCTGVVVWRNGSLEYRKDKGSVNEVYDRLRLNELKGMLGLGHTRFSTHGRPHHENAHPHLDCKDSIAVVGDGVIANYESLRDELIFRGHYFKSRCDFEVVPHLMEELVGKEENIVEAFRKVVKRLDGVFSIALTTSLEPSILVYTKIQPFYVGVSDRAYYVSSTKSALKGFADKYIELADGEIAYITRNGVKVIKAETSEEVRKVEYTIDVPDELVIKDGFPHYMLKEIYENPYAILRAALVLQQRYLSFAARLVTGANKIYIIANGTSLHAGMVAGYYLTELADVSPVILSAAEFPLYHVENVSPGTLVIAISQSGETSDVVKAVYEAKLRGATILAVTNNIDSRLAKLASLFLPIGAGPEISVPATKTFTSTLITLYMIALKAGEQLGKITGSEVREYVNEVRKLAFRLLEKIKFIDLKANEVADKVVGRIKSGYVLSRGINYPIALEGALKLKEAAYFHAEGMEAGEFRHGPITLVGEGLLTVFIMPAEPVAVKATYPLIKDAYERGASVIVVSGEDTRELIDIPVDVLITPQVPRHLSPIANAIPLQLLAYRLGVKRNCPIDTPKKLVKAITSEI